MFHRRGVEGGSLKPSSTTLESFMRSCVGRTPATNQSTSGTLLYVTDLEGDSDEALASVCEMADRNCVDLELVHVVDVQRAPSSPDAQMGILYRLETLARRLRNIRRNVASLLLFGTPEDVISKRAWDIKAKLVAFGINGASSRDIQRKLVRRVRRRVSCPVVIIAARAA